MWGLGMYTDKRNTTDVGGLLNRLVGLYDQASCHQWACALLWKCWGTDWVYTIKNLRHRNWLSTAVTAYCAAIAYLK